MRTLTLTLGILRLAKDFAHVCHYLNSWLFDHSPPVCNWSGPNPKSLPCRRVRPLQMINPDHLVAGKTGLGVLKQRGILNACMLDCFPCRIAKLRKSYFSSVLKVSAINVWCDTVILSAGRVQQFIHFVFKFGMSIARKKGRDLDKDFAFLSTTNARDYGYDDVSNVGSKASAKCKVNKPLFQLHHLHHYYFGSFYTYLATPHPMLRE